MVDGAMLSWRRRPMPTASRVGAPPGRSGGGRPQPCTCFSPPAAASRLPYTPVWLMRQAGRYLPEYRAVRERLGFLELCQTPELAAEVTLHRGGALGVDAAIVFADILLPLEPMGVGLEFTRATARCSRSPVRIARRRRRGSRALDPARALRLRLRDGAPAARAALGGRVPLIGFAGAPFTLASYLVEGGGSRDYVRTKRASCYGDPAALARPPRRARATARARYLRGPDRRRRRRRPALRHLGRLPRRRTTIARFVLPPARASRAALAPRRRRVIHFAPARPACSRRMREAGGDVIGLDWRVDLDEAWQRVGARRRAPGEPRPGRAVRAARRRSERRAAAILAAAPRAAGPHLQPRPRHPARDPGRPRPRAGRRRRELSAALSSPSARRRNPPDPAHPSRGCGGRGRDRRPRGRPPARGRVGQGRGPPRSRSSSSRPRSGSAGRSGPSAPTAFSSRPARTRSSPRSPGGARPRGADRARSAAPADG